MATSIKQMIQELINVQLPRIVTGTVTATDPLRITLLNDIGVNLSAASLIIPSGLLPLESGDQFYMLTVNNNKTYYLLDRM